jgi:hypothetical protein
MPRLDERQVFETARHIRAPDARRLYIQQACGDDGNLQTRVEALLRVHEEGEFLESPAAAFPSDVDERPGTQIGASASCSWRSSKSRCAVQSL